MAYYGKTDCVEVFSDDHVETTARHDKDDCGDICDGERERERDREREREREGRNMYERRDIFLDQQF